MVTLVLPAMALTPVVSGLGGAVSQVTVAPLAGAALPQFARACCGTSAARQQPNATTMPQETADTERWPDTIAILSLQFPEDRSGRKLFLLSILGFSVVSSCRTVTMPERIAGSLSSPLQAAQIVGVIDIVQRVGERNRQSLRKACQCVGERLRRRPAHASEQTARHRFRASRTDQPEAAVACR